MYKEAQVNCNVLYRQCATYSITSSD